MLSYTVVHSPINQKEAYKLIYSLLLCRDFSSQFSHSNGRWKRKKNHSAPQNNKQKTVEPEFNHVNI